MYYGVVLLQPGLPGAQIVRYRHSRGAAELSRLLGVGVEVVRRHVDAVSQRLAGADDVQRLDADVVRGDKLSRQVAGAVR